MIERERRWLPFQEKVRERIDPILVQEGFQCVANGIGTEESTPEGHPYFSYERAEDGLRIEIDALKRHKYESGQLGYFDWIRVAIGSEHLKHLFPVTSTSDIYEMKGWVYTDKASLEGSIDEIVELLRKHFD